jgi:hypothetical protein
MEEDTKSLFFGFLMGAFLVGLIWIISSVMISNYENSGYAEKLVIKYHCPGKEYERKLFRQLLEVSNVETNFIDRQYSMDKHRVELRLTNPSRNPNDN